MELACSAASYCKAELLNKFSLKKDDFEVELLFTSYQALFVVMLAVS
jgi:hypothetical protein